MLEPFHDYLGERVLEAGCGAGNLTNHLIDRRRLTVVDIDPAHISSIDKRYGHLENFGSLCRDLEDSSLYDGFDGAYDAVICINVLEHLESPEKALAGFQRALRPGGYALLLVPAHGWLFSAADTALGHHKRYEEGELDSLVEAAGLIVVRSLQFNRLGVLGWAVNKSLGRTTIGKSQARLFSWLLPLARMLERISPLPGLSWIVIASKP
jgi:SAM-dependent methyltransferase